MEKNRLQRALLTLLLTIFVAACSTVPLDQPKLESHPISDNQNTELGALAAKWKENNSDKSGFYPLLEGMDGLGARLELAERAELSIDLQYFMMKDDTAGLVMTDALLKAADRGVRIRFLLDDIFTTEPDSKLHILNQHPNIEIRLFNPVSRRGIESLNFVAHFGQANRRMHNKSFTVDNAASIIGGRNIADEYFQLKKEATFADFDMFALGPIARDISASFDMYWNHTLAIPVEQLSSYVDAEKLSSARADLRKNADEAYATVYQQAIQSKVIQDLMNDQEKLYPANARVLSDDPEKLNHRVSDEYMLLVNELNGVLNNSDDEIIFLTPYYIAGDTGVQLVEELIGRGMRIVVVTNSLASTNHVPVHSGYAGYRKEVINAGVELYEVRANAGREMAGGEGPEALTLHTKLILIDRRFLFVGSLNLDPRSFEINAEMGVLIDSEELTTMMAEGLDNKIPNIAYHVVVNDNNKLEWHGIIDGEEILETHEPQTSSWLRFKAWFMKIAPVKEL